MPAVEVSSALGDVRGYEFGNYGEVYFGVSFPRKNADRLKTFGIKLGSDAT